MSSLVGSSVSDYYSKLGIQQSSAPRPILAHRPPGSSDTGFAIGQIWVDQVADAAYVLVGVNAGAAVWQASAGSATVVSSLTGNSGGALSPASGNLNVVGSGALAFAGSGSTLTGSIITGGMNVNVLSNFSAGGAVQTTFIATNVNGTTVQLPLTSAVGSIMIVTGTSNNTGGFVIAQLPNQTIRQGASSTTTGTAGAVFHVGPNSCIVLLCVVANTDWVIVSSNVTLTIS